MRYQPDPDDPLSFFDVRGAARVSVSQPTAPPTQPLFDVRKASYPSLVAAMSAVFIMLYVLKTSPSKVCVLMPQLLRCCLAQGGGMTRARACWFHKDTGVGAWGVVPLVAGEYGKPADNVEVGLRYSTPAFTAGAVVSPAHGVLNQIWMVRAAGSKSRCQPFGSALASLPSIICTKPFHSAFEQLTQTSPSTPSRLLLRTRASCVRAH